MFGMESKVAQVIASMFFALSFVILVVLLGLLFRG